MNAWTRGQQPPLRLLSAEERAALRPSEPALTADERHAAVARFGEAARQFVAATRRMVEAVDDANRRPGGDGDSGNSSSS